MSEFVASTFWIFFGFVAVFIAQTRFPTEDRRYLWLSFWAHIVSAFVLIWLTYNFFGRGDLEVYYFYGDALADYIRSDPGRWGPEVGRLILQQPVELPIEIFGSEGSSTTSLIGITAFLMIMTNSSEFASGVIMSLLAFSGQWALYCTFRHHFPAAYRKRVLIATLLVPSAVFWTSGVVKEAVAIAGMGWMIWGLHRFICDNARLSSLFWIALGAVVVGISKSYILFPMAAAGGVWFFWHRSLSTSGEVAIAARPLYLVGAGIAGVVAMVVLGELFPQYSIGGLAEEAAELQYQGEQIQGGSSYAIGDAEETSLMGQLAFAPVAITASLFRPFIFEAHNSVALINAIETTVVLFLWLRILWTRGVSDAWRLLRSSPALMFCVVFIVLFGLGVGLATTNLGTLSRYRVPMMPLYGLVLLMLLPLGTEEKREKSKGDCPGPSPSR